MKVSITKKIGKSSLTFYVEEPKELEALAKAAFFTTAPDKCTDCESENVQLDSNRAEGYTFVKIRCLDCGSVSQLGQYRDGTGCFWKKFQKYNPQGNNTTQTESAPAQSAPANANESVDDGDLPF